METNSKSERIVLVEDDTKLGGYIQSYLSDNGYVVHWHRIGLEGIAAIRHCHPNLVVLDLMLPDTDGLTICREIRRDFQGPILMFTAKEDPLNEIIGLEMGADDFLYKPVEPRLLLARVRALLRRSKSGSPQQNIQIGPLSVQVQARLVRIQDKEIQLTSGEFDLLVLLARAAGEIVTREQIFQTTRGIPYDGLDRSADVKIAQLRKKLSAASAEADLIRSVRSKGYIMILPESPLMDG